MAGEFASRVAVEKITRLLPAAFKRSAVGLPTDFKDVLEELFTEIHRALMYLAPRSGLLGDGRHPESLLVYPRLDVLRPYWGQPNLLFSCPGRINQTD